MKSHKLHVADQQMMCYRTSQVHMMIILKKKAPIQKMKDAVIPFHNKYVVAP